MGGGPRVDDKRPPRGWVEETEGEFKGWLSWPADNWEMNGGPFYMKRQADGSAVGAFRAEPKHMNSLGHMHGGCMMTFADFFTFALADPSVDEATVTVSLNSEFVRGAVVGDLIEASGEVVKRGRNLIFTRGILSTGGKTMMNFSAVLMRTQPRKA
jgi:uncharacterized protein (TIGR00369 family)